MKKYLFLLLALVLIGCEKDPSGIVETANEDYQILNVQAPSAIMLHGIDTSFTASVKISSSAQLNSVWCTIYDPDNIKTTDFPIYLKDSGKSEDGDHAAGDSIYSVRLNLSKNDINGTYRINFYLSSFRSGERNIAVHSFSFDNGQPNHKPVLSRVIVPDTLDTSAGGFFYFSVKATDNDGLRDIRQVVFQTFRPDSSTNGFQNVMYDDGDRLKSGDTTAVDGIYAYKNQFPPNVIKGNWTIQFQAFDKKGLSSDKLYHKLYIK